MAGRKRRKKILLSTGWMLFMLIPTGFGQINIDPVFTFSPAGISQENDSLCSYPVISPSGKQSIYFNPVDESIRFALSRNNEGIPYKSTAYLVIDLEHNNPASLVVLLEFCRKGDEPDDNGWVHSRISARVGILPQLPTRLIFPLSYLDAQQIFLPRFPRQLKGTISGNRMETREIEAVYLRLKNTSSKSFPQDVFINGIYLFDEIPPKLPESTEPIVDSLGQWASRKWKGKISSFESLEKEIAGLQSKMVGSKLTEGRSPFMGFLSHRFDSTGFFHTHHDGQRWWLVDPHGYAYLSVAPTGVRAFSHGPVENNEGLFEWLPPDKGLYSRAYAVQTGLKSLSFLTVNLIRLWGRDFLPQWLNYTGSLMRSLGFTGSGNWSDTYFHENGGLPYFYPMTGFPTTKVKLFRDFPDVYDPAFSESAEKYARQLEVRNQDPFMIGYFLGNEPHWAFGEFNLAREMLYKNENSYTRQELIRWLTKKYRKDPYGLSASWGYEFQDFNDLNYFILPHENDISPAAEADLLEFTGMMVDEYARVICKATEEASPNHLNLGLRFAWISSKACLQTGKYFDVFSLNGYTFPDPPDTKIIADEINRPVIIGEFHFGSIDRGLPATGIKGVQSQAERGKAYRHYVEQGFSRPEIVGIHYFQWNDQPLTGRFDGENYNIGIVDVTCRPYVEMARSISKTNSRLFEVASGLRPSYRRVPREFPAVYY